MKPGGTFISRRFGMSPKVRASRWMKIASRGQPSTKARVFGSARIGRRRQSRDCPDWCYSTDRSRVSARRLAGSIVEDPSAIFWRWLVEIGPPSPPGAIEGAPSSLEAIGPTSRIRRGGVHPKSHANQPIITPTRHPINAPMTKAAVTAAIPPIHTPRTPASPRLATALVARMPCWGGRYETSAGPSVAQSWP
jgi:hypothetical protein